MQVLRRMAGVSLFSLVLGLALSVQAGEKMPAAGKIAEVLKPFVDKHELAGAVTLVADADKVLDLEAVGWADMAEKKPMRTDAMFWIASQSKPITGAALMILVDEGKVNVDDPVEKYLPEFKDQWLAVEQDKDHVLLKKPKHPYAHERSSVQVRIGGSDAGSLYTGNPCKELCHDAASV
jgi:CubicO group peptidase (beta-lactamase class C family)